MVESIESRSAGENSKPKSFSAYSMDRVVIEPENMKPSENAASAIKATVMTNVDLCRIVVSSTWMLTI